MNTFNVPFTVVATATLTVPLPATAPFVVATVKLFNLFVAVGNSNEVPLSKPM